MPPLINKVSVPAIPPSKGHEVGVIRTLPKLPYLPYVFGQVMMMRRGGVTYDWERDEFILYFKPDQTDKVVCPFLNEIEEVWLAITGKKGRVM